MDDRRFDALVRTLVTGPASRRAALRLLAGGALGGLLPSLGVREAAAGCAGTLACPAGDCTGCKGTVCGPHQKCCRPHDAVCTNKSQCCSGRCRIPKGKSRGRCKCTVGTAPCGTTGCCAANQACVDQASGTCGQCLAGTSESCYTGPAGTEGVGRCKAGTRTCQSDNTWGPCQGQVLPRPEICNGLDDDCDGEPDNGFNVGAPCDGSDGDRCFEGVLVCDANGGVTCNDTTGTTVEIPGNGQDEDCNPDTPDAVGPEICGNLIDDDGDGMIDEEPCQAP